MPFIKIAIADPVFLVREGFKKIIENKKHLKLISEIAEGKDLWIKLENSNPDILILDYNNNGFLKLDDIPKIKEAYPTLQIIIIYNDEKKENILYIIKNGVNSYLTKECGDDEICNAIDSVLKNEKFFCNKILDIILEKQLENQNCESINLSFREIEVTKLIVEGLTNKEISDKLFISIHTVYTHRKNIMRKLQLKSPVELVLYAINADLMK